MLTEQQIAENKERFIELIRSIDRKGMQTDRLIAQFEASDFFIAPASTIYHNAFRGGLCQHSLNVYDTLCKFVADMFPMQGTEDGIATYTAGPSLDSIKIVSLLHDFDKMNKYEKTVRNQKVYSETGSKYDEMGKYDWVSVSAYKRKEVKDTFYVGTHGENSVYMAETFIPLTLEEHVAILNHHSVYDNPKLDSTAVFNKYSLACLLHLADVASTYILEKV